MLTQTQNVYCSRHQCSKDYITDPDRLFYLNHITHHVFPGFVSYGILSRYIFPVWLFDTAFGKDQIIFLCEMYMKKSSRRDIDWKISFIMRAQFSRSVLALAHSTNPLTAKLFNLNLHPLEVVSRWRDPQLQASENYSDLTKCTWTIFKSCWLMSHFIFNMFESW